MKIKKNDTVRIIAGKDKGKTGKVIRVRAQHARVVVEGVNVVARHVRPRKSGECGQKIYFPAALPVSKVMIICPRCGAATRVGSRPLSGDHRKKRERVCKKCKEFLTA